MNYWDMLMETDEGAANYMVAYGEGPGCLTRENLAGFIIDKESVLDVGCGPGWNYDHFKTYGPRVKYRGEDYSERFVRVANQRHPDNELFFLGDCRDLKHPDKSFDVVILQDCVEHTNGYERPVIEALRVAKRRVIVTFWRLSETDNPHINDDGDDGYGADYDKRAWERFLDTLPVNWFLYDFYYPETRKRYFYVLDKQEPA